MSSRFGAQQQPTSRGGVRPRGRFQSGFVPAGAGAPSGPPLERAGSTWLVNIGGNDTVEMTGDEVAQAWREGRLEEQTLVWRPGLLEWTALCAVPQLSISLGRSRPVGEAGPEDVSEDDLTELWAPPAAGGAPRVPALGSIPAIRSEPEQLPEDEVTELWDSRGPDPRAVEAASLPLDDIDNAPSLTFEEIDYDDEQLAEDEVTTLWAEHGASGLAAVGRAPLGAQPARSRYAPARPWSHLPPKSDAARAGPVGAVPLRSAPPQPPARLMSSSLGGRPTQPSMVRIAEIRAGEDSRFVPAQPFARPAGITTIAFWADGVRGLYELASTRLEWVVDRVIRVAERRGTAAWQGEGFQSRTAVFLTEMRTVVTSAILAALARLGQWTAHLRTRMADRVLGRVRRRYW